MQRMLYHWYELSHAAVRPARAVADGFRILFNNPFNVMTHTAVGRSTVAACEVFERTTRRYSKPTFGLPTTSIDDVTVGVKENVVWKSDFCEIINFRTDIPDATRERLPKLLVVAPMSGHYATLLRGTVEAFLPSHDVYITDWQDARDIPVTAGSFDLDDYVDTMRDVLRHFGGDVHVFSVCQPSVPVLAAVALMEMDDDPHVPLSMTLAGGPIDTRVSPTAVNKLAEEKGTRWFRNNVITTVPWPCQGFGRQVYPGFLQLTGFMTMNLDRHVSAHKNLFLHLVRGDGDSAEKHRDFYDEYMAVMDLTAEFYLQTIERVFVEHRLAKGTFEHRGRLVDLTKIRRVSLMTVEGQNDDITGIGQCRAALDLCSGIPEANRQHFECPNVGHYGIFNGSRFRREIAPRMRHFMRRFDPRTQNEPALSLLEADDANGEQYSADDDGRLLPDPSGVFTVQLAADAEPDRMASQLAENERQRAQGNAASGSNGENSNSSTSARPDASPAASTKTSVDQLVPFGFAASLQMWSAVNSATLKFFEGIEQTTIETTVAQSKEGVDAKSSDAEPILKAAAE